MMKRVILVSILVVFTLGILLCQGMASTETPGKQVTIRFVWINMPDKIKDAWVKTIFEPFEKIHPNIKIDFQAIPNVDDTIKVQIAAGQGPDLFMTDAYSVSEYAKSNSIQSFDPYVRKYGWNKLMFDWALNAGKYHGKQYAIPHAYECTFLIYNKDLLDANGWPIPKTRAEFEKVCAEAANKGIIPIAYWNLGTPDLNQWLIDHYLATYSDNKAVKDLFTGKINFNNPKIRDAFKLLKSDWDKGWWNEKRSAGVTMDDGRALWTGGKALFTAEGSWFTEVVAKGVKFNFGCTKWPSMRD